MNITSKRDGELLTVYAEGKIDSTTADTAEKAIEGIRAEKGYTSIVLDFEKLQYISSAGLRIILGMQKQMNRQGGAMTVRNVSAEIMEIFDVTGFSDILTIE